MTDQKEPPKKRELTAQDRLKAVDIKEADMYVFSMKHKLTGEIYGQEHYMVIRTANGRKHVFRQVIDMPKKSGIIGGEKPGIIT